jgi:hypothetical protein
VSNIDTQIKGAQLVIIGLLGGAALYILYQLVAGSGQGASKAGEAFFRLLNPRSVADDLANRVQLPSGELVTFEAIVKAGSKLDSRNRFTWNGNTYQLTGSSVSGTYEAIAI